MKSLWRGACKRCPRCGKGKLFARFWVLSERCTHCDLSLAAREDDTWFFMYMSTAAITGTIIICLFFVLPRDPKRMRWVVGAIALIIFVVTNPIRKGLAIGFDYWFDSGLEAPRHE